MYSVYSNKAMVNGYIQWSGDTPQAHKLTKYMEEYTCYFDAIHAPRDIDFNVAHEKKAVLLKTFKDYDIRTIILHKNLHLEKVNCLRAKAFISILLEDVDRWEKVYDDGKREILWLKY